MITFREAVSSAGGCLFNTKSEEEGKKVRERRRETKAAFEERERVMGWTNILHTYCSIYFLGSCLHTTAPIAHALINPPPPSFIFYVS
jgi:hypothetical protein